MDLNQVNIPQSLSLWPKTSDLVHIHEKHVIANHVNTHRALWTFCVIRHQAQGWYVWTTESVIRDFEKAFEESQAGQTVSRVWALSRCFLTIYGPLVLEIDSNSFLPISFVDLANQAEVIRSKLQTSFALCEVDGGLDLAMSILCSILGPIDLLAPQNGSWLTLWRCISYNHSYHCARARARERWVITFPKQESEGLVVVRWSSSKSHPQICFQQWRTCKKWWSLFTGSPKTRACIPLVPITKSNICSTLFCVVIDILFLDSRQILLLVNPRPEWLKEDAFEAVCSISVLSIAPRLVL